MDPPTFLRAAAPGDRRTGARWRFGGYDGVGLCLLGPTLFLKRPGWMHMHEEVWGISGFWAGRGGEWRLGRRE